MEAAMAMRGFGMQVAFAGAGLIALALAGGCSSSNSGSPPHDAGLDGIHRLEGGGQSEAGGEAGTYTGPPVTSCSMSVFPSIPAGDDGGGPGGGIDAGGVDAAGLDAAAVGDGGPVAEAGAPAAPGTTGKFCTSDADCNGNLCNLSDPTPVCIVPVDATGLNCDPGTDGMIHRCDGPDCAGTTGCTTPGICLPLTNPPTAGQGVCVQECIFKPDGSAAIGCTGNNACNPNPAGLLLQGSSGGVIGLGYCGGGCMTDADCHGPWKYCATDFGVCVSAPPAALPEPCGCFENTTTMSGFCAKSCVVGRATKCPTGTVCDALEPTMITDQTNTASPAFTKQNTGLVGTCLPSCTDGACPDGTTCITSTAAGPDCEPQ
jgi:hypothetical protein